MRLLTLLCLPLLAQAAEPAGTVLFEDSFNAPAIEKGWRKIYGEWKQENGALKGVELAGEQRPALLRHNAQFQDGTVALRFRFDGAFQVAVSFDSAQGHICRVVVQTTGFHIYRDSDAEKGRKGITLANSGLPISSGAWHDLTLTFAGSRLTAKVDDALLSATNSAIADPKIHLGLRVSGDSASYDWIKVTTKP
jgi:hypothetical protein